MTLCMVIKTHEGLIGLGDSTVVAGSVRSTKSKLRMHALPSGNYFTLTSGLRSITDKVISYGGELALGGHYSKLYEVATEYGRLLRRVRDEDAEDLARSRLVFDGHILLGGRLSGDDKPTAFLIYPQGNWIEIGRDTPFLTIGKSSFGLYLLKSLISFGDGISHALKAGLIAFEATALSSVDVDYPVDVVVMRNEASVSEHMVLGRDDVKPLLEAWNSALNSTLDDAPEPQPGLVNEFMELKRKR